MLGTEDLNPYSKEITEWDTYTIVKFIHLMDIEAYYAVFNALDKIAQAVDEILKTIKNGGRVFYVGAGTSGRIAAQDIIELEPTYGIRGLFEYIIAGGREALERSVERAEDDEVTPIEELKKRGFNSRDIILGISASGRTPFVIASMKYAKEIGSRTIGITNNKYSKMEECADILIELISGPEVIQGSTRMKAGTAQKMTLNIISTTVAIKLGYTYKNMMYRLRSNWNSKLFQRSIRILITEFELSEDDAKKLLEKHNYLLSEAINEVLENRRKNLKSV